MPNQPSSDRPPEPSHAGVADSINLHPSSPVYRALIQQPQCSTIEDLAELVYVVVQLGDTPGAWERFYRELYRLGAAVAPWDDAFYPVDWAELPCIIPGDES